MNRFLLLLVLGLPIAAQAQEGFPLVPETSDSRSVAMGRTSIAAPAGSNAIFTNPAGIAVLNGLEVAAGGRLFFGTLKYDANDEDFEDGEAQYDPHLKINPLSAAMPYALGSPDLKLAFGLGYQTYFDFGRKLSSDEGDYEYTDDASGGLNTISPAVALSFRDRFFVGISYNKSVLGDLTETVEFGDDDDEEIEMEVETSGSFWMLGGLARVTPQLTVGVVYRPAFEWEWQIEEGSLGGLLPGNVSGEFDLEVPALFGVGAAVQASPNLLIVGEYQNRPFSDYEVQGRSLIDIDDGHSLRLGAEIQGDVPVRFGVFRDHIFATDGDEEDPLAVLGVTGGLGLDLGGILLDAAVEYGRLSFEPGENVDYAENLFNVRATARYRLGRALFGGQPSVLAERRSERGSASEAGAASPAGPAPETDARTGEEEAQETVPATDESAAPAVRGPRRMDGGVGIGIPYGILGSNFEYAVTPNLSASMGLGTTVFAGMGWSAGVRYYVAPPESALRPRVGAFFGTNAMVIDGSFGDDGESFTGLTVGAGFKWMWGSRSKRWGLDADVLYLATSEFDADDYEDAGYDVVGGDVKLSLGLRFEF